MRFSVISSCILPWGGSEELWTEAALHLQQAGHQVAVLKTAFDAQHPRIRQLRATGCTVTGLAQQPTLAKRLLNRALPAHRQWTPSSSQLAQVRRHLQQQQPDLAVVAQGSNFDGLAFADICRCLKQPFVVIAQKAAEVLFPPVHQREMARLAYRAARHCYFVSRHNLTVTQHQLGQVLDHASVVPNPFNVPYAGELPWPPATAIMRLACVARLEVFDKGQDILLQVLALPKWRQRPLHVSFFGHGGDEPALRDMAALLGLHDRVTWAGQVPDITTVWASHHALVLPSRYEGLPLALTEAMLCGRPAIATAAGGTAELLVDNETGFLAGAATVAALDEALERAWGSYADWPVVGRRAAAHARAQLPPAPGEQLGRHLLQLLHN
ncbi:glycosyltransferase family 4 protein [Hymenobacter negativus]|uniref:Glycosyltransferase family 4 protein n=1 Tax=Hymenobacter negativus TaxID=2795026 RepID=A0ABS3Q9H4_9BACT|nr:glycosyltransferase family 4 protein [Hymenobacter negativus]MBO2007776.1 glycosyltransferase family 4 protein [Hymenobacter negativus]